MKKRVFIDMDGTLYRFHDHILDESGHVQIEKMYELDFFVKLESFENMKEAINLLHSVDKEEIEIFILSSADTKEVVHQKNICIDRDFPFIDEEHRLFPKTWESKTDKIPEGIYVGDILIDDYNVNLEQWKDKGGTYSNGSDERDYADQWFERCWFGMFPEPTLLNHLLNFGYEPEHYLDMLENVETIKSDIEITKQNIAEPSDEWKDIVYHKYNDDRTSYECVPCYNSVDEYIASEKEDLESYKADLEEALEELKDMRADWKPEKEPNMDEEIELIKKWVKEREDFINE